MLFCQHQCANVFACVCFKLVKRQIHRLGHTEHDEAWDCGASVLSPWEGPPQKANNTEKQRIGPANGMNISMMTRKIENTRIWSTCLSIAYALVLFHVMPRHPILGTGIASSVGYTISTGRCEKLSHSEIHYSTVIWRREND